MVGSTHLNSWTGKDGDKGKFALHTDALINGHYFEILGPVYMEPDAQRIRDFIDDEFERR